MSEIIEDRKSMDRNQEGNWASRVNEFARDFARWIVNLLRDCPRRAGRLTGTVNSLAAVSQIRHLGPWIHALLCYLFDLFGGPELTELVLHLITRTRPLDQNEIRIASIVLGPGAIRFREVRVAQGGLLQTVFRFNKDRAFATWHTINLPYKRNGDLALMVHELTHVYQYERVGTIYIGQGLWAQAKLGRGAYDYGGAAGLRASHAAGKCYRDYNREQQGQIAQDFCTLLLASESTSAYTPFIEQLQSGAL